MKTVGHTFYQKIWIGVSTKFEPPYTALVKAHRTAESWLGDVAEQKGRKFATSLVLEE